MNARAMPVPVQTQSFVLIDVSMLHGWQLPHKSALVAAYSAHTVDVNWLSQQDQSQTVVNSDDDDDDDGDTEPVSSSLSLSTLLSPFVVDAEVKHPRCVLHGSMRDNANAPRAVDKPPKIKNAVPTWTMTDPALTLFCPDASTTPIMTVPTSKPINSPRKWV